MSTKEVRCINSLWLPDSTLASYLCCLWGCSHENKRGSELLPSQWNLSLCRLTLSPPCDTVCTQLSWALLSFSCPSPFTLTACCSKLTVTESTSTSLYCLLLNIYTMEGTKHSLDIFSCNKVDSFCKGRKAELHCSGRSKFMDIPSTLWPVMKNA